MIITCPACSTRYRVSDTSIGTDGRTVKCARCGHRWHQETPPAEVAEPEPAVTAAEAEAPAAAETDAVAAAEVDAADEPVATTGAETATAETPARPRPRSRPPRAAQAAQARPRRGGGWLALAVVLLVVVGGGYLFRANIVQFWPPAGQLYRSLGVAMPKVPLGLDLRNVASTREIQGGQRILVVTGEVWNIADVVKEVPQLRVSLGDEDNNELHQWTVTTSASQLQPGESVGFTTRLADPPDAARRLAVTFQVEG